MVFKKALSGAEYWDAEAKKFNTIYHEDGRMRGWFNKLLRSDMEGRYFFTLSGARADTRPEILEIGCGTGVHTKGFIEAGAASVTGIDFSAEMLKIAAERLKNYEGRVKLVQDDFMTTDFAGRSFDVVTALGVFDYAADSLELMKKAVSLTKGRFIASFPRSGTLRSLIRTARLALKRCPVYFYSKEQLISMAKECGTSIEKYEIIGQLHCVIFSGDENTAGQ